MYKKLTNGHIDLKLLGKNIARVDDYVNAKTPLHFRCLIPGCCHIWKSVAKDICNRGSGCPKCAHRMKLTNEIVDERLSGKPIKRIGNYINLKTPIDFQCKKIDCLHIWLSSPSNILDHDYGCPKCANRARLNNQEIDKRLENRSIKRLDDYVNNKTPLHFQCNVCEFVWKTAPDCIINAGTGCPKCSKFQVSKIETVWLDSLGISDEYRQINLKIDGKKMHADGFDPSTNTVYEFYGDYWHGNPNKYKQEDMHPVSHKTYGELYQKTMDREKLIKEAGYTLITIWENDFKKEFKK